MRRTPRPEFALTQISRTCTTFRGETIAESDCENGTPQSRAEVSAGNTKVLRAMVTERSAETSSRGLSPALDHLNSAEQ